MTAVLPLPTRVEPAPAGRQTAVERLTPHLPTDRLAGWLFPLLITLFALLERLHHITDPRGRIFDEVYYTKDAHSLLKAGVELTENGSTGSFVVHPPLGKWAIAAGEAVFGNSEMGWRVPSAVAGTLAVLILARTARRITGSTALGSLAGLLLALDGMELVQSRIGILDIFLMFWLVAALACLVADRDTGRRRLAAHLAAGRPPDSRLGVRWWRLACGFCIGAALGTKWSGIYFAFAYAVLALVWDSGARRTAGCDRPFLTALRRDGPAWLPTFTVLPFAVYTATWTGWFVSDVGWDRHKYGNGFLATLHGWLTYHREVLHFHTHLTASHPYASKPLSWLLLGRPVLYSYDKIDAGTGGCAPGTSGDCVRTVLALGNPAIWWGGTAFLVVVAWLWLARRDWRAALVLAGVAAGILPWLAEPNRTMFIFYALPALPFLVLGLVLVAGLAIGGADASPRRRVVGTSAVVGCVLVVLALYVFFLPIWTHGLLTHGQWESRMWFPGWI